MHAYIFLHLFKLLTGELYVQAQMMFDDGTYTQLLAIIRLVVKQSKMNNDNFEVEYVSQIFILYLLILFAFLF